MFVPLDSQRESYQPYPFQDPLKLDNTKRETFRQCERKYFYQYVMGYKPIIGSTALRYGIVWHKTLEAFYRHIAENGWTRDGKALEAGVLAGQEEWNKVSAKQEFYEDYRTLQNLFTAFMSYIDHFAADEGFVKIIEPEQTFQIPMELTPEEQDIFPNLKPFLFTGKLDLAVELNGLPWRVEFKTTGQQLAMQKSRLHRRAQYMGYLYASSVGTGVRPEGMLVMLHHLSAYKSKKTGQYGKPKIDFDRSPEIFDEGDIRNWRLSFLSTAERLQIEQERNLWPMNHDSCYIYGRCTFCKICEQNRPLGQESLDGYFQDEPWDVTKEE
jgi:hypothetical protein